MTRLAIDTRRRISLSKFLPKKSNIHAVNAHKEGNKIILELMSEIPADEAWVFENPKVIKSIRKGIQEAKEGKTSVMPDFTEFANDEI